MFWLLVFAGPTLLILLGIGMFANGIRAICSNYRNAFCWLTGIVSMAFGSGVFASGFTLFDFVFSSIK